MKLAVFNGSPRGSKSNSTLLIEYFLKGYRVSEHSDVPVINLADRKVLVENVQVAGGAENIIVVFPLYTVGTIIKGGSEGLRMMPQQMTRKLFNRFYGLGSFFKKTGSFSEEMVEDLRSPRRMSGFSRFGYRLFSLTGLTNMYWNTNLKKYNAYKERFAKPYE